ncbi:MULTISPECIES: ABC transporter ATP-binding protein [Peptoniphilus]|uniref:ABC transporter ATP-binding protein n=1 Tax=Peptoniphilus TaxID=162289 RepID=UPI0001DCAC2A|nr:ATP-binding cassette domain-containing protein [Peptoniphilus sp. oral taxon 836]EFK39407.1 ABC transporter, ATP-binding protein [Peptoniphilus sp. oral taxon 836 str. F0141]
MIKMLKIDNITKTFYKGTEEENRVFENFSLKLEENSCTTILGANGCGKSTLFNIISGEIHPESGQILLGDLKISDLDEQKRAAYIGKVNQNPSMGVCPSLNILENMSMALNKGKKFTLRKLVQKSNIGVIVEKLKEIDLGLENKLNTQVKFLSGGQRQSLSLIMATIKRPELLLLDEHTAALDPKTSKIVMDKTENLIKKEKITTLMITHNLRNALDYSDRIIMLDKGKIVLDVKPKDISENELRNEYNIRLRDQEKMKLVS